MSSNIEADGAQDDIIYPSALPFLSVHLACIAAIWSGVTLQAVALCVVLYWLRIFAIGAGYHRYFSHRAYSTSRAFQFALAFLSQTSAQKSVLWWAVKHRQHHLHSDTLQDVHSPRRHGFIYSHLGWIFARKHGTTDFAKVADLTRYPELVWLHRLEQLPAVALALACLLLAGWDGLVVGFFWSTVLVYHATFSINSLAHVCGSRQYVTGDDSRNNWFLAIFTTGEGWHNNHHACQSSVRQGFGWWEVDPTYYLLKGLSALGVVWKLKTPPAAVLRNEQRLGTRVLNRAAAQLTAHFNPERLAVAIRSAACGPELLVLQEMLTEAQHRATEVLTSLHLPQLPTREEFLVVARAMFARTPSLDDIVDRAYECLLASVGARLAAPIEQA